MGQPLHIGSVDVPNIFYGGIEITSAYYGTIPVFSTGGLGISPKLIDIGQSGGTFTLRIRSVEDWNLSMDTSLMTASAYSGTTADTGVTITVLPNVTDSGITSVITASTINYSATCEVNIEEGHMVLSPNAYDASPDGETFQISLYSPEDWTLSMDSTYLSADAYSGTSGNSVVMITVEPTENPPVDTVITASSQNFSATTQVSINDHDWSKEYLTFKIKSDGNISWSKIGSAPSINQLQYSINDGAWTGFALGTTINVVNGDKVRFKATNTRYASSYNKYNGFANSTADFDVCGNINSILQSDGFTAGTTPTIQYSLFTRLFSNTNIIDASNLIIPNYTDSSAFSKLQSTFRSCSKMVYPPTINQSDLTLSDLTATFQDCPSLKYLKILSTRPNSSSTTNDITAGITASTGVFVKLSSANWATGINGIPSGWTVVNQPTLTVTPSTQTIPASGGTFTLNILSSDNYKLSMDNTYLSASAYKGTPGDREVIITVEPNTCDTDIVTTITATTSNYTAETTVSIGHNTVDYSTKYLTMKANSAGNIVWMVGANGTPKTISYSLDSGSTWSSITSTTNGVSIPVSAGDEVLFKGTNERYQTSYMEPSAYRNAFQITDCDVEVKGNIMSMIYGDNFENQTSLSSYALTNFFFRCSGITSVENLVLPATTLNTCCYEQMFYECTGITKAPVLPAATLSMMSYTSMFNGCTSLNYVKCLASNRSAQNCTLNWLNNVAATGTFVKASGSTWPTGVDGIPSGWTVIEE